MHHTLSLSQTTLHGVIVKQKKLTKERERGRKGRGEKKQFPLRIPWIVERKTEPRGGGGGGGGKKNVTLEEMIVSSARFPPSSKLRFYRWLRGETGSEGAFEIRWKINTVFAQQGEPVFPQSNGLRVESPETRKVQKEIVFGEIEGLFHQIAAILEIKISRGGGN